MASSGRGPWNTVCLLVTMTKTLVSDAANTKNLRATSTANKSTAFRGGGGGVASYEAAFGGRTSLPVSGSAGLSVDAMEAGEGIYDVGQWQKCWYSYGSTRKYG